MGWLQAQALDAIPTYAKAAARRWIQRAHFYQMRVVKICKSRTASVAQDDMSNFLRAGKCCQGLSLAQEVKDATSEKGPSLSVLG